MRAKVTFRKRGSIAVAMHASRAGAWSGEYEKQGDEKLPQELREILPRWRAMYQRKSPSRRDIRVTLEVLTKVSDHEARAAVLAVDGLTQALLAEASHREYRLQHPQPAPVPAEVMLPSRWTAGQVRNCAARAAEILRRANGRPEIQGLHVQFARALLEYWTRTQPLPPTMTRDVDTPFSDFAGDMFRRIGYGLSHRQLYRIVSQARR